MSGHPRNAMSHNVHYVKSVRTWRHAWASFPIGGQRLSSAPGYPGSVRWPIPSPQPRVAYLNSALIPAASLSSARWTASRRLLRSANWPGRAVTIPRPPIRRCAVTREPRNALCHHEGIEDRLGGIYGCGVLLGGMPNGVAGVQWCAFTGSRDRSDEGPWSDGVAAGPAARSRTYCKEHLTQCHVYHTPFSGVEPRRSDLPPRRPRSGRNRARLTSPAAPLESHPSPEYCSTDQVEHLGCDRGDAGPHSRCSIHQRRERDRSMPPPC